jgi:2Fe-2S ferredoxin
LRIGPRGFTSPADIDFAVAALAAAQASVASHPDRGPNRTTMPRMTFIERDGTRREVDAPLGLSVLEIAHKHGIDIEGACEGSLACSTCHVIVDPAWYPRLARPTEDEEDMLDLAFGLEKTSRLGCQIVMTEALDGLVVRLPAGTRNLLNG